MHLINEFEPAVCIWNIQDQMGTCDAALGLHVLCIVSWMVRPAERGVGKKNPINSWTALLQVQTHVRRH